MLRQRLLRQSGYAAYPFLSSLRPGARAQALGGPVQVGLTRIEPGQLITVVWRGKPVWVVHRTAEMLQRLSDSEWLTHLSDPLSSVRMQQPAYARNGTRSLREKYFVAIVLCTHLGRVPLFEPQPDDTRFSDKWIGGFFWMKKDKGTRASETSSGHQEVMILVKGGYTPDVIVVQKGRPVRLNFRREETASCSEMVLLPDFEQSARLPTGETVAVEFVPQKAGEYEFACQMRMLRGKLIVE